MRLEPDQLQTLISSSYFRGEPPDLIRLIESGVLGRPEIARAVLLDSYERRSRGYELTVSSYQQLLSLSDSDDGLWSAVINQTLTHLVLDIGLDADSAVSVVADSLPDRAEFVRQIALLNPEIHDHEDPGLTGNDFPFKDLPFEIGPPDFDGRPRYELRSLLGTGAQGAVYAAVDRVLTEPGRSEMVAFKLIPIHSNEFGIDRVLDEARAARQVRHKGVVVPLDAGRLTLDEREYLFITYELIDGQTLESWSTQSDPSARTARQAVQIALSVADAVAEAHRVGVVHRDIKPNNIILTPSNIPMLTDFGLATRSRLTGDGQTQHSGRGSLGFKPPEQYGNREGGHSPEVDVYALGGLLFWMFTGHATNGDSLNEAIRFLEHPEASPRQAVVDEIHRLADPVLAKIVLRAICPDRARRCPSATELATDLQRWLEHQPIPWIHRTQTARALLKFRRHPAVSFLVFATVCTMGSLLYWGGHQASLKEKAILEEKVAGQDHLIEEVRKRLRLVWSITDSYRGSEPSPDWLPSITMLESLMDPVVFKSDDEGNPLWKDRVEIVEDMLEEARSTGKELDFETRLWAIAQGVWMYRAGQNEQAASELSESRAWLIENFGADDKMTRLIRAVNLMNAWKLNPETPDKLLQIRTFRYRDLPRWIADDIDEAFLTVE